MRLLTNPEGVDDRDIECVDVSYTITRKRGHYTLHFEMKDSPLFLLHLTSMEICILAFLCTQPNTSPNQPLNLKLLISRYGIKIHCIFFIVLKNRTIDQQQPIEQINSLPNSPFLLESRNIVL